MTMVRKRFSFKSILLSFLIAFFCLGIASPIQAMDLENLSRRVATSVTQVANRKYATVAFSRITGPMDKATINDLIDYTNVALVKSRSFRVIDRSKLTLILREQKFNLTGMVSQDTYKELGKLLGVDLFIYGRYYQDTLVMKAIDVESSALVWADIFQLKDLAPETLKVNELAEKTALSLRTDLERLQQNNIKQVAFWNIQGPFDNALLADFLATALTKDGHFQVVDRENLALILQEQKLSMSEFIDESKAKKMGELYGVDAFIYGKISKKKNGWLASFKLLNIYNGVIEWADLIHFGHGSEKKKSSVAKASRSKYEGMTHIPFSSFKMGRNRGDAIHRPEFTIKLKDFYLDTLEVSNREYSTYLKRFHKNPPPHWKSGQIPMGKEKQPVVNVTWIEAKRYCKAMGKRLPMEVEWEKAYRGESGHRYPWGNRPKKAYAHTVETGLHESKPVDYYNQDISYYGVKHMAGNVREWVDSTLKPYPKSRYHSTKVGKEKVIRGGSWAVKLPAAVGWHRSSSKKTYAWKDVGFRCAKF